MSYYDIDDIFAEELHVTAICRVDMDHTGSDIEPYSQQFIKDNEIAIPFWLAVSLASRHFVMIKPPGFLGAQSLQQCETNPAKVNIAKKSPYFYEFAFKFVSYLITINTQLPQKISRTVKSCIFKRFLESIRPHSTTRGNSSINLAYFETLAELEKRLFRIHERAGKDFHEWRNNRVLTIPLDPIARKIFKRPRLNY